MEVTMVAMVVMEVITGPMAMEDMAGAERRGKLMLSLLLLLRPILKLTPTMHTMDMEVWAMEDTVMVDMVDMVDMADMEDITDLMAMDTGEESKLQFLTDIYGLLSLRT